MSWAKSGAVKLREKHQHCKTLELERQSFWWLLYFLEIISPVSSLMCFPIYLISPSVSHTPRCTHTHRGTCPLSELCAVVPQFGGLPLSLQEYIQYSWGLYPSAAFISVRQAVPAVKMPPLTLDAGNSGFQGSWWEQQVCSSQLMVLWVRGAKLSQSLHLIYHHKTC